ncbi:MAG TPA: ubiquitin-like domain-containing protein [Actinomycetes bacterium]|nr:ubiquitin-like domain-containing protein [Actinomycetes bacterium]
MRRSPWLLALDIALVVAVVAGITGFARSDKHVTLSVDGQASEVHTFADTVGGLLQEEHLTVSQRDVVSPSPADALVDGATVDVKFARQLSITIDGQPKQIWTTAVTVDQALDQLGVRSQAAVVSASRSDRIPLTGLQLGVQLPDRITVLHDSRRTTVVTAAPTVGSALREAGIRFGTHDHLSVSPQAKLSHDMNVSLVRVAVRMERHPFAVDHRTIRRGTSSMYVGNEKVVKAGHDGRGVAVYRLIKHDGVIVRRVLVKRHLARHPAPRIVVYGTKERPYSPPSGGAGGLNWDALAQCESGGNPSAVNAGGYYGLYQFSLSTWYSVGGSGNPVDAASSEQTYRAQVLYSRSGASPWPVCGSLLFS